MMDYIFLLLIILGIIFFFTRMLPVKGIGSVSTAELIHLLNDKNIQFIDVRTPAEFKNNHLQQFQNIPLHELATKAKKLDPTKETILICQSGMRSMRAAKILKKAGFTNLVNIRGGMNTWHP